MSARSDWPHRCVRCGDVFFPFKRAKGVFCDPVCQRASNRERRSTGLPLIAVDAQPLSQFERMELGL